MSQFLKFDTKFRRANSPPCITARRDGCVTNQMVRSHRKRRSRGGFPSPPFHSENHPRPRDQRRLRGIFLIARPPLLAVMQGGEFACLRFPANSGFLKPFGILAEIRISEVFSSRPVGPGPESHAAISISCFR